MSRTATTLSRWMLSCALLGLAGCLADSVGVGDLTVVVEGATTEGVWVGRPGEDTLVRVRLYNLEGEPVAGARVSWLPTGTGSNVSALSGVSDQRGYAVARWRIGTDASEQQELRFTARNAHASRELVFRGQVVPSVVASLRAKSELPLVARVGDTLHTLVVAVDPYNNEFPAPNLSWSVVDAEMGMIADSGLVAGPRRGVSMVRVASGGIVAEFPLHVVQRVASIAAVMDTLWFTSLRAEQVVAYEVRDDRGLVVVDTAPAFVVADSGVAQLVDGRVRALRAGATSLRLSLGGIATDVAIDVRQRIASLRLIRDTVRFDALQDTTTLVPVAFDSLGSAIVAPQVVYEVSGDSIARLDGGKIEAVGAGTALITARDPVTGITTSVEVLVRQRVAVIDMPATALAFDALADSQVVTATPRDRLGSVVGGVTLDYVVADTTVAAFEPGGNRLLAMGEGQTTVTVRDPESGVEASRAVHVEQVATTLNVVVTFANAVVSLPAGAELPLECTAADRNGFTVAHAPRLVRTVRGTVTGAGCTDARIARSGYDTLFFALGTAQVQVPVIVSTRPDSVGVVVAAQPLSDDLRTRFEGEDFNNPLILALRPLVAEIMAGYGNPTSNLDRARALRDWVARTAIHPDPGLHPDGSTANLGVLPAGKTWADVNAMLGKQTEDHLYWGGAYYEGYVMLDRLLGTLDPTTGLRADDGMMVRVEGAQYRIKNVETYHYVLCSYQTIILNALWAADELHGLLVAILNHDPAAVFIPELGEWVYEDPTFNEEYRLDGVGSPLSPLTLLALSTSGQASRLHSIKVSGPIFDPEPYITRRYLDAGHPEGMLIMGSQLYRRVVGNRYWSGRYVQTDVPALATVPAPWSDGSVYRRVSADVAFPILAPVVIEVLTEDSVHVIHLGSTYPNHQRFERRLDGQSWETVDASDVLPVGACRVEYRSVDVVGSVSASAILDVWAPRSEDFVRLAPTGTVRARAQYCASLPIQ